MRWRRMPTWPHTCSVTTPAGSLGLWWCWMVGTCPTWPACSANSPRYAQTLTHTHILCMMLVHTHAHTHTHTHTHSHTCTHTHTHTHIHVDTLAPMLTDMHVHMHPHLNTHIHTYTHVSQALKTPCSGHFWGEIFVSSAFLASTWKSRHGIQQNHV